MSSPAATTGPTSSCSSPCEAEPETSSLPKDTKLHEEAPNKSDTPTEAAVNIDTSSETSVSHPSATSIVPRPSTPQEVANHLMTSHDDSEGMNRVARARAEDRVRTRNRIRLKLQRLAYTLKYGSYDQVDAFMDGPWS